MGTRSLTYVFDGFEPVVCIYRQFDGYPEIHGKELKEILEGIPIVDGVPPIGAEQLFNGVDDMAATLVARLREMHPRDGNIRLIEPVYPPRDVFQEYEWYVFGQVGQTPTVYYRNILDDTDPYGKGWVHWFGPKINIKEISKLK